MRPDTSEIQAAKTALEKANLAHSSERRRLAAEHRAEERKRLNKFKDDLFAEHGVSGPKANLAYDIAWADAHSDGLEQVASRFAVLVDLIK